MTHYVLQTPVSEEDIRKLRINDTVTLQNTLFGIRDATQIQQELGVQIHPLDIAEH